MFEVGIRLIFFSTAVVLPCLVKAQQQQTQCFVALVLADDPDNYLLNEDEYVSFVNRLSGNAFNNTFESLPQSIQTNFFDLALDNGQINIVGSSPGQATSEEQYIFLSQVCSDTSIAIDEALAKNSIPSIAPLGAPTSNGMDAPVVQSIPSMAPIQGGTLTPRPTRPFIQCFVGLISSDVIRDEQLTETEYVMFVNFMEPGAFASLTFDKLDVVMQENFMKLADNATDTIDISGLPVPNEDQALALQKVCDETNSAISLAIYPNVPLPSLAPIAPATSITPTSMFSSQPPAAISPVSTAPVGLVAPTITPVMPKQQSWSPSSEPSLSPASILSSIPSSEAPSSFPSAMQSDGLSSSPRPTVVFDESTEIVNQFVVSNVIGVISIQLNTQNNSQRTLLDEAYATLVETTMKDTFNPSNNRFLKFTKRELLVEYVSDDASAKYFVDVPCPERTPTDSLCQEVVASFSLALSQNESLVGTSDLAQQVMDTKIGDGGLQNLLTKLGSQLMIEHVDMIVNQPSTFPSTLESPSPTPNAVVNGTSPPTVTNTATPPTGDRQEDAKSRFSRPFRPLIIAGGVCLGVLLIICVAGGYTISQRTRRTKLESIQGNIDGDSHEFIDGLQEEPEQSVDPESNHKSDDRSNYESEHASDEESDEEDDGRKYVFDKLDSTARH